MFGLDDLKQTRYFQDVKQDGRLEKAREAILSILETRFTSVPQDIGKILNNINDSSFLDSLIRRAVIVQNINEFQQLLKEVTGDN
jgi:hypothetical protein